MNDTAALSGSEIAVVGMSGRFPGAKNLQEFWNNLRAGVESVHRFSEAELVNAGESREQIADPDYVRARPVLADVDQFDAGFFGFSPQDAAILDPQHRIFLEVGCEALEDAGHDPARFAGQVGVFATCGMNTYMMYHLVTNPRIMRSVGEWLVRHTGNDMSFLATGLSYHLNLTGPSMNVQCACSSALVAIHLAAQSLLNGECDMALAGGSVVALPQDRGYLYQSGEILARDGHCRPFDAHATGTLFGNGAGVVVLRRLADALADGDRVLAVVKGSAVNNDGSTKVGFLAPSVDGQSRVITEALAISGVGAETISYVEAHGTGTIVGDPIEVTALSDAFRRHTDRTAFCRIGSLKSNIGHLGEAAGVAAFIKTVLSLQHRQLPPSLNFDTPNPQIDFAASPFVVNTKLVEWDTAGTPRRAGITALGAGGTNCHVIVEEAPAASPAAPARREQLLVLSAKTPSALDVMRTNLAAAFETPTRPDLADAAYTLQLGRGRHPYRWSAACTSHTDAILALREGGATAQAPRGASNVPVVFLFPGGGAQYPNMGRGLYDREPVFKAEVDRCLSQLRTAHNIDLGPMLYPDHGQIEGAAKHLARSTNAILSIFIVEYALSRLWMSWGISPSAMSGHSLGEYVAACLAGVFTVEDALTVVKARGDVFERLPAGSMLSVLLSEAALAPRLDGRLALAAVNASLTSVVSGPCDEIDRLNDRLTAEGVETQRLHIDVAAHSPMLDPFLDEFRRRVSAVRLSKPTLPFVSNLTGRWITAEEATDPGYWVSHLRHTVQFSDGLATLLATPDQILLEVGPGRALTSLARQQPAKPLGLLTSLRHPSEDLDDVITMMTALGRMWGHGVEPAWGTLHAERAHRRVSLPTYPFDHQRYWVDAGVGPSAVQVAVTEPGDTTKQPDIADWFSVPTWVPSARPVPRAELKEAHILVFGDDGGLAAETVSHLRQTVPGRTWFVECGDHFARVADDRFVVHPTQADDYVSLFASLGDLAFQVTHILHAWNITPTAGGAGSVDAELDRAFFAPLALAQAMGRQELDQPIAMTFVTSGSAQVAGESTINPVSAALLGPVRVMPREFPNVSTKLVDILVPISTRARIQIAGILAADIAAAGDTRVALRGQTRWVERFSRQRLQRREAHPLRDQGVYVVTGGLGGLGLEIAGHLARAVRARLVLVGRSAMPIRLDWDRWLSEHDDEDSTSRRIRSICACEALGSRVIVAVADVADPRQMADVREQAIATFGVVHGLFHTAGTLDDGLMQSKTREAALGVLRPKVHGTLVIQSTFEQDALDFMVLFSSVSATLGLQGQVDYTAANACLDLVADQASGGPTRVVSINWGPWQDVGLAVSAARDRDRIPGLRSHHPWLESVRRAPGGNITLGARLGRERQWMIGEHVVRGGDAVLPGTGYLELARAALAETPQARTVEITDVHFQAPVIVRAGEVQVLAMALAPAGDGYDCTWETGDDIVATGHVAYSDAPAGPDIDLASIRGRCTAREETPNGFLNQPFMEFGPRWANLQRVAFGRREALVFLALPEEFTDDTRQFLLHPALLDMATGGAQALIPGFNQAKDFYVPVSYGRVRLFKGLPARLVSHVRLAEGTGRDVAVFDVTIADETGGVAADITGFCMRRVATHQTLSQAHATPRASARLPVSPGSAAGLADEMLRQGIRRDEGLDALDRVLEDDAGPRVIVSPGDITAWQARVDAWQPPVLAGAPHRADGDAGVGSGDVETRLGRMWQDLLGVESVGPQDNFFEIGGHSLLAVRLLSRIEKAFRCSIPLHRLFNAATIAALADEIRTAAAADGDRAQPRDESDDDFALTAVPRDTLKLSRTDLDRPRER